MQCSVMTDTFTFHLMHKCEAMGDAVMLRNPHSSSD